MIVSDNAANILSAVRLGGWRSLTCYVHTINLIVQSSIDAISDTKRWVKDIIEYFHRSAPAKKKDCRDSRANAYCAVETDTRRGYSLEFHLRLAAKVTKGKRSPYRYPRDNAPDISLSH